MAAEAVAVSPTVPETDDGEHRARNYWSCQLIDVMQQNWPAWPMHVSGYRNVRDATADECTFDMWCHKCETPIEVVCTNELMINVKIVDHIVERVKGHLHPK
jgi:hypothetical protein